MGQRAWKKHTRGQMQHQGKVKRVWIIEKTTEGTKQHLEGEEKGQGDRIKVNLKLLE